MAEDMIGKALRAADELRVTERIRDTDAVCTLCRGRAGHLSGCERENEPWPEFDCPRVATPAERMRAGILAALDPEDEALVKLLHDSTFGVDVDGQPYPTGRAILSALRNHIGQGEQLVRSDMREKD